jgi:hypothetical protein
VSAARVARVELAALNNALWCQTVCSAHGVPGELLPRCWRNPQPPPPYHSNLVLIASDMSAAELEAQLRYLAARLPSPHWGLKDSYANQDLSAQGFRPLFEAAWIWREPADLPKATSLRCSAVHTPEQLADWESHWRGDAGNAQAAGSRQFPEALLLEPGHRFIACSDGERFVAGAIANRTPGVIGLSNLFVAPDADAAQAWATIAGHASEAFPGIPLVGYERGDDLRAALAAGFKTTGPLRVWTR